MQSKGKVEMAGTLMTLSLDLRICPVDKRTLEQRLEEHRHGSIWTGVGEEIAFGRKEPGVARAEWAGESGKKKFSQRANWGQNIEDVVKSL